VSLEVALAFTVVGEALIETVGAFGAVGEVTGTGLQEAIEPIS